MRRLEVMRRLELMLTPIKTKADYTPLYAAACNGHLDVVHSW
jgi:hypothetical protein